MKMTLQEQFNEDCYNSVNEFIKRSGLSPFDFAKEINVSYQYLKSILNRKFNASPDLIEKICKVFRAKATIIISFESLDIEEPDLISDSDAAKYQTWLDNQKSKSNIKTSTIYNSVSETKTDYDNWKEENKHLAESKAVSEDKYLKDILTPNDIDLSIQSYCSDNEFVNNEKEFLQDQSADNKEDNKKEFSFEDLL